MGGPEVGGPGLRARGLKTVLPLRKFGKTVTWHDINVRGIRTYVKNRLAKGGGRFGKTVMVGKTVGGGGATYSNNSRSGCTSGSRAPPLYTFGSRLLGSIPKA
jgi:hypothetical protein